VRRSIVSTVGAVVLPALLLFGCGGTDDPDGSDPTQDGAGPDDGAGADTEPDAGTEEDLPDDVTDDDTTDEDAMGDGDEPAEDAEAGSGGAAAAALEPRVEEAIALLVDDGIERDAIEVVLAEPVVWSDGSIGCPEPDVMYTQALVEGYRVVLAVDGEEIAFHGADNQPPFRCDGPVEPASGGNPSS
jgi:hypothetical protein